MCKNKTVILTLMIMTMMCGIGKGQSQVIDINVEYPSNQFNQMKGVTMTVRGDGLGLNWQKGQQCTRVSSTLWQLQVNITSKNAGQTIEFKALINDNQWSVGSNYQIVLPKQINADTSALVTIQPFFRNNAGSYSVLPQQVYSETLQNWRSVVVYTPPSYY